MTIPYTDEAREQYEQMRSSSLARRSQAFPTEEMNRVEQSIKAKMREFQTGATRHTDEGKLDYEGFLNPRVLERFAQYMHANRVQADGAVRTSDNWQKGIPKDSYMKSLIRHVHNVWMQHRGYENVEAEGLEDALCAVVFNAFGYLYELIGEVNTQAEPPLEEIQHGVYQPRWADSPDAHPVL